MVRRCRCLLAALLSLSLCACASKEFVNYDGAGSREASGERPRPQEDLGPWPDGITFYSGEKIYAHSGTQLFSLDPKTLDLTVVGTFGPNAPNINDLAVTPNGLLYGISTNDLWRIDHKTAQVTNVAKIQGTDNVAMTFEASGTLLGADKAGTLRRIDPKTGTVTDIGSFGPGMSASGDLVAIKDGTLFATADGPSGDLLVKVDPKTGKATTIGAVGATRVWGLGYWKGTVYGLTKEGGLLAIDPKTGKGTKVRSFGFEFWGAAVTPLAPIE